MGNVFSIASTTVPATEKVMECESETISDTSVSRSDTENVEDIAQDCETRAKAKEEEMDEFRKQLSLKREQRKLILARHKTEKKDLEEKLNTERKLKLELSESNRLLRELLIKNNIDVPDNLASEKEPDILKVISSMREEFDKLKSNNNKLRKELAECNFSLQAANSEIADLSIQNTESMKQIIALKEVVTISKTMINLRDQQLTELKDKLSEIEQSLADREADMLSNDLRQEYQRQLQNIRTLRGLYEDRARLSEVSRQNLVRELEEQKAYYEIKVNKCKELTTQVEQIESKVSALEETLESKNYQITTLQDETQGLNAEMSAVNKLFSQVLLGYKNKQDLDKLVTRLEENHGILTHMAEKESDTEASSALPKLLLELVNQVDEVDTTEHVDKKLLSNIQTLEKDKESRNESVTEPHNSLITTAEEIVENLPKVWRVLMELLSHQTVTENSSDKVTTCYKSVDTKSGPVLVPSVSQTYIRLKDLIVEKLALIKEVNRMKQLNGHLETRLEEQERRLSLVSTELSKTWHVVGRLRRHHHQLHTHEKILKYELQQKRKLLNELKEELEYCREKWEQARQKNSQSEKDWRKLRAEFSSRKTKINSSINNSAESGYSDERPSDDSSESNDESEYITESLVRCKKKNKKSFEIPDSSTDLNPVAEREDPASDLLDIADLSLDTQDGFENLDSAVSNPSHCEHLVKGEKLSDETEDEMPDLNYNTDHESSFVTKDSPTTTNKIVAESKNEQDDEVEFNRPTISSIGVHDISTTNSEEITITDKSENGTENILQNKETIHNNDKPTGRREVTHSTNNFEVPGIQVDPKAILESIKKQNERLAKKDKRLNNLEKGCKEVIKNMSATLTVGDCIMEKMLSIHNKGTRQDSRAGSSQDESSSNFQIDSALCNDVDDESFTDTENVSQATVEIEGIDALNQLDSCSVVNDVSEPSTSAETDHEAKLAARELRLTKLEEQTKSLVKKVNKTTSKCVRINYKLEELHNIYGSESSRAGTPSEDTADRSQSNDDDRDAENSDKDI